jgi:uncharacterized membrane protein
MKKWLIALLTVILSVGWLVGSMNGARADGPTVHAVLFYDLQCPHCEVVREEVLPPLQTQYGNQFIITQLEINDSRVYDVFLAALDQYSIPPEMRGVPFLIVGDSALIGSQDIPDQLPGLIDHYLAAGGVDYPAIPGLEPLLNAPPEPSAPATRTPDTLANSLAIAVMVGMVAALGYVIITAFRKWRIAQPDVVYRPAVTNGLAWRSWIVPILALIGLGVATYLAYVETTETLAVCGPVGDCNAVQSSPYAKLFGIPIGVLGALTYLAMLSFWAVGHFNRGRLAQLAPLALFGLALFGVLFSLYLTYLEPFVIGAVCAWCLTSAVTITILLLVVTGPGLSTLAEIINPTQAVWQEEQK